MKKKLINKEKKINTNPALVHSDNSLMIRSLLFIHLVTELFSADARYSTRNGADNYSDAELNCKHKWSLMS